MEFCKQNSIKTAIITNRDSEYIEQFRIKNRNGQRLFSLVDTVVTADQSRSTKPNPEILQFALNIHGINPTSYNGVFFIGDALADLNVVRNEKINGNFILMAKTTSDIKKENLIKLQNDTQSYIFSDYYSIIKSIDSVIQ